VYVLSMTSPLGIGEVMDNVVSVHV